VFAPTGHAEKVDGGFQVSGQWQVGSGSQNAGWVLGGCMLTENGSEAQKHALLPRIAAGELLLSYGLSEPNVGGNLASVETSAERQGDQIIVKDAKRWCTEADWADYIYCLVRSGNQDAHHNNLSMLLISTDTPSVTMQPIEHISLRYTVSMDVYFDDVCLDSDAIVGGPDMWNQS